MALIATTASFTFAQTPLSFGIRAGLSNAGIRGDAVKSFDQLLGFTNGMIATGDRTGFFAGGYVHIPVSNQIAIEPAVYYSQKGMALQGNLGLKGVEMLGANARARLNTQYIDIPVVLKLNLNGFQLFGGPQVSYLSDASLQTSAGVLGLNLLNTTTSATNQFNRWDAALTGGVGYTFTNGINLSAAYDHGITRVDANRNANAFNRAIKVGLGFQF